MSSQTWTYRDLPCELKLHSLPVFGSYHCGYVTLPAPVDDKGYDGLAAQVDVHGGITYAGLDDDGSCTYGFDTAHYGSGPYAMDEAWCRAEVERMADQLLALAGVVS